MYAHFESIFWFCALSGTGMLIIQFLMSVAETGLDSHENGKFKWMFRQALTGFMMMFGWAGVTCNEQFRLSLPMTLLISLGVGAFSAFVAGLIFHFAKKAHSPGTVFRIEDALGKEATVYHRIPKEGSGKISILLYDFTHEIDAVSFSGEEIASFTPVQIIKKMDNNTVVVVPLKPH
jgi:hypothetical protein